MVILIFTSCEDVIDVDVPTGTPRLVIDASFEFVTLDDGSLNFRMGEDKVKLSVSTPFFERIKVPVTDARVFISNTTFNLDLDFQHLDNEPGTYIPQDGSSFWDFNSDYQLTVIHNNETYTAKTKIKPSVPIDNIIQKDGTLLDDDETEINITFTDDGSRNDFYLFDFDFDLFFPSEDEFYQGQQFDFSYFYEDMKGSQEVTVKILGIEKQYFDYMELLVEQSEQSGNPFQATPSILRGNLTNTTNKDNYPWVYFNMSESYSFDLIIIK